VKYTFGVIFYRKNLNSKDLCERLVPWFKERNISFALEDNSLVEQDNVEYLPVRQLARSCNFLLVLGGDGSILRTARHCIKSGTVIAGIHKGTTGFLTELDESNVFEGLQKLLDGDYQVQKRLMLKATVIRKGKELQSFYALNDAILKVALLSRIVAFEVRVNGVFVEKYRGDGVVVSTPTGSTGFSLSNGGPIVRPDFDLLLMSPICPRQFNSRPMLFSASDQLTIKVQQEIIYVDSRVFLTMDGQVGFHLQDGDEIVVSAARNRIKIAQIYPEKDFYTLVREKIG
jgi:NAD+ kinase